MPASASGEDEIVATWRGGKITLKEFEDFALYTFYDDTVEANTCTFDKKRSILKKLININLAEIIADSLQLDTLEIMQNAYKSRLSRIAFNNFLFIDSVHKKIVSDKMIRNQYDLMKNSYNISDLFISETNNNSKYIIDSLYSIIKLNPDTFGTLLKINSEPQTLADDPEWKLLTELEPEYADHVINLEANQISAPFKTIEGWHIIRLNSIVKNKRLSSFKKEEQNIKYKVLKENRDLFDRINDNFQSWILKKYNVFIDTQKVDQFTDYFRTLATKDINLACDYSNYKTDIVISIYDKDTIFVKNVLDDIRNYINSLVQSNSEIPDITTDNIYDTIFYTHIFKIRPLIIEDLGYTKKPEVLKIVKEGNVSDYKEYLIENYLGTEEQENKWFLPYYKTYEVVIDHSILEKSFYEPPDDRK